MLHNKLLIFCIIAASATTIYTQVSQNNNLQQQAKEWPPEWTEKCIGCICQASSKCNQTIGCIGDFCGMFLISQPYWIDAGSPILQGDDPNDPKAFKRCVLDSYCASRTVNQYINKFIQDCNNDGVLSCDDYARLHFFGYVQCSKSMDDVPFHFVFQECFKKIIK